MSEHHTRADAAHARCFLSGDMPTLAQSSRGRRVAGSGQKFLQRLRGTRGGRRLLRGLMELTGGTFRAFPGHAGHDAGGVFIDRPDAERNGRRLDVRLLLHVTIRRGQIVEGVDHFHPEHVWDAFWA